MPLYIHENWRWQPPSAPRTAPRGGRHRAALRARIGNSSAPVFDNQPFLKDLEQFIVADMGSHILDAARFLFGEAESVYCRTQRVHRDIRGEDVATIVLGTASGMTVTCEISYASRLEDERFPETFVTIEGRPPVPAPDYWLREMTAAGTLVRLAAAPIIRGPIPPRRCIPASWAATRTFSTLRSGTPRPPVR